MKSLYSSMAALGSLGFVSSIGHSRRDHTTRFPPFLGRILTPWPHSLRHIRNAYAKNTLKKTLRIDLGYRECVRTRFLEIRWIKHHQNPAAKRRNVIARHAVPGRSGKGARVP